MAARFSRFLVRRGCHAQYLPQYSLLNLPLIERQSSHCTVRVVVRRWMRGRNWRRQRFVLVIKVRFEFGLGLGLGLPG